MLASLSLHQHLIAPIAETMSFRSKIPIQLLAIIAVVVVRGDGAVGRLHYNYGGRYSCPAAPCRIACAAVSGR